LVLLIFISGSLCGKYLPFYFFLILAFVISIIGLILFRHIFPHILIFVLAVFYIFFSEDYIKKSQKGGISSIAVIKEQRGIHHFNAWVPYIGNVLIRSNKLNIGEIIAFKGKINHKFYRFKLYSFEYKPLHLPFGFPFILREKLSLFIAKYIPGEEGNFVQAIFLGKRHLITRRIFNAFKYTGAAHILSISGLHTGIMFFIIFLFLRAVRIKFNTALVISGIIVSLFGVISGLRVPIQRALLIIWLFIIGEITERMGDRLNIISFSALLILVLNPENLYNIGFQLSFASVYGIILFWENIHKLIFRWGKNRILNKWITYPFSISLAAQISTIPIVILKFHYIAIFGTLSNLVLIPLTGFLLSSILLMIMLFPSASFTYYVEWWISYIIIKTAEGF